MQVFRVDIVRNLSKRKWQNIWGPNLVYQMWLFLCCFQKPYHIKISNCNLSYCWGDVQWWADGGGAGKVWACITWVWGGERVVKGTQRVSVIELLFFSHVLKFTWQGDINVNMFFRSGGSSSTAVASFPVPGSQALLGHFLLRLC